MPAQRVIAAANLAFLSEAWGAVDIGSPFFPLAGDRAGILERVNE
jgi:hypothetical protein